MIATVRAFEDPYHDFDLLGGLDICMQQISRSSWRRPFCCVHSAVYVQVSRRETFAYLHTIANADAAAELAFMYNLLALSGASRVGFWSLSQGIPIKLVRRCCVQAELESVSGLTLACRSWLDLRRDLRALAQNIACDPQVRGIIRRLDA